MDMVFSYGGAAGAAFLQYFYLFSDTVAAMDPSIAAGLIENWRPYFNRWGNGPYTTVRGLAYGGISTYASMLAYASAADVPNAQRLLKGFIETGAVSQERLPDALSAQLVREVIENPAVQKAPVASGSSSRPYAISFAHHRPHTMAFLRGFNHFLPSTEIFGGTEKAANVYGQQQGNGFLQLIGEGGVPASGLSLKAGGWDWALYPGATTVDMDIEQMRQSKRGGAVKLPEPALSGSMHFFGANGMAHQMLYSNPELFLGTTEGRKSWFFFEDLIVCLGSGLSSSVEGSPLVTTLFAFHHSESNRSEGFYVGHGSQFEFVTGDTVNQSLYDEDLRLMDPQGHVYIVPNAKVDYTRREQESLAPFGHNKPTSGFVSTALIDHGIQPENASHAYAIFLKGGEETLRDVNVAEHCRILQMDERAHVVQGLKLGLTGYAILEGGEIEVGGLLKSSKYPLLAMVEEPKGDVVRMALCDPDPLSTTEHVIELNGRWELASFETDAADLELKVVGENTAIMLRGQDGRSHGIHLKRMN